MKRVLPRSLFGRTLLIFVAPIFIMLAVATYVFFNRHWYTVTQRMATGLAGDVSTIVELLESSPDPQASRHITHLAGEKMGLNVRFSHGETIEKVRRVRGPIGVILGRALNDKMSYPYVLNMSHEPNTIGIRVEVPDGVYTILSSEKRVYTPTTQVFIVWLAGSSILLTFVALLFMRNQIRPIRRLADAAEAIGKGREVPWFKVEGSSEARQAGAALLVMRDRLKRQMTQRTAMLAGVSHDLRTPLTRMKLGLELMGASPETAELSADIAEMEEMLNAYLAFARGEETEPSQFSDIMELMEEVVAAARRQNPNISLRGAQGARIMLRRAAMKRCLTNLVANALRYGTHAETSVQVNDLTVTICIDDDGPGIPASAREDMFRPFNRMEESRNQSTGGVGLGLTIARDIARSHGGDVVLEDSPLGGLRAKIWMPI